MRSVPFGLLLAFLAGCLLMSVGFMVPGEQPWLTAPGGGLAGGSFGIGLGLVLFGIRY